jgi:mono/diheme cytochrome c family protein
MTRRATMPALAALALLAGCGETRSDPAQVRSAAQRYFAGLANGDGAEVCSLLTGEAQQQVLRAARTVDTLAKRLRRPLAGGCPGFVSLYAKALAEDPQSVQATKQVKIGSATVRGVNATVRVQERGTGVQLLPLVKTAHGWRISELRVAFAQVGSSGPTVMSAQPPPAVAQAGGRALAQFYRGRTVVAESGCLACHLIGADGNAGPGPDLSAVGSRLPPLGIERALVNPTAPMPSFRNLPRSKLQAVVAFLSDLRE